MRASTRRPKRPRRWPGLGRVVVATLVAGVLAAGIAPRAVLAEPMTDCFSEDWDTKIRGCTEIIDRGALSRDELANAHASRALAWSMKGRHDLAIQDYDRSIDLHPNHATALNNRAWSLFRTGRGPLGLPDVEKSLRVSPASGATYDTRAHIRQVMGNIEGAIADYDLAMQFGGERMIRMYQCGLTEQRHYNGPLDGLWNPELKAALVKCVRGGNCDPLPADEDCRKATS